MKKIIASASLVTLGVASLNAAYAPGLSSVQTSKPWNVSASLRGFYDDNYTTRPAGSAEETFGFEVKPSVGYNMIFDQTTIGLGYTYGLKYYEESDEVDHSHELMAKLSHAFSEQVKLDVSDTFSITQEPQIDDAITTQVLRSEGDNLRNIARIALTTELTDLVGLDVSYGNNYYDYEQEASDLVSVLNPLGAGSYSALLDRTEHYFQIDPRWKVSPTTDFLVGYRYGITDYNSDDPIDFAGNPGSIRDNNSHYGYVGVNHNFNNSLTGSLRAGVQYVDYDTGESETSPYVDATLTYQYLPGSTMQLNVRHAHAATDALAQDQQATSAMISVTHKITSVITGTVYAKYQHSEFVGGTINVGIDGDSEDFYSLGAMLAYKLNEFASLEAGYTYDNLESDDIAGRGYERNRVYAGVRASF